MRSTLPGNLDLCHTEGIVLRTRPLGESARLVIFLTPTRGRVAGVVREAGPQGASGARYEPFTLGELVLAPVKMGGLASVDSFEIVSPYDDLRSDLDLLTRASYLTELLEKSVQENQPAQREFGLLLLAYGLLLDGADLDVICRWFEIQLLSISGHGLILDRCASCGRLPGEGMRLSLEVGGLCCGPCAPEASPALTRGAQRILQNLSDRPVTRLKGVRVPCGVMAELKIGLRSLMGAWLGELPKSAQFMDALDRAIQGLPSPGSPPFRSPTHRRKP